MIWKPGAEQTLSSVLEVNSWLRSLRLGVVAAVPSELSVLWRDKLWLRTSEPFPLAVGVTGLAATVGGFKLVVSERTTT